MPFVRASVPDRFSDAQVARISEAIHASMVETFDVPADDRFQVISRHRPGDLVCSPSFLGISHSADVVLVQITCSEGRTLETKRALFKALARSIARDGAVAPSDVIVNLVEVRKENWSFGDGLAQYAA
ncbi:MAG TPA: tautomerase family protein [Caldimonas sp.]|nr:tautomerase family protein [Caldimonas sp.]